MTVSTTAFTLHAMFYKLSLSMQYGEEGDEFDPNRHEAMFQIPAQSAEQEPGKIGQVSSSPCVFLSHLHRDGD